MRTSFPLGARMGALMAASGLDGIVFFCAPQCGCALAALVAFGGGVWCGTSRVALCTWSCSQHALSVHPRISCACLCATWPHVSSVSYAIRISVLATLAHVDLGPVNCARLRCSRGRRRSMREALMSLARWVGQLRRRRWLHHVCQGCRICVWFRCMAAPATSWQLVR